ncbi:hypothetical protein MPHL43072_22240 [Mycolicibacterium phlei DSM 43072]|nr:hypothetical protein MPHL43072_22240 [Mycolicibacterium phlei DSM 43072]
MYLVVECSTMSAPSSSGCCKAGEANVLSTNTFTRASWATAAIPEMSAIDSSGLVGVSTRMTRVLSVIAARTASRSASDTAV